MPGAEPGYREGLVPKPECGASVKLSSGDDIGAQVGQSSVESIAQLGERLATIMLLRDEFSDLCRSYANGAVSATTYSVRLSKLDRKMVSLMMGEMAAGAFGRDLANLGGTASYGGDTAGDDAEITKAREDLKAAETAYQAAVDHEKTVLAKNSADIKEGELEAARFDVVSKQTAVVSARQALNLLYAFQGSGTASSGPVSVPGGATVGINSEHRVEIARTLERIQHNFISDDQSATLIDACISALDYAPTLEERVKQLAEAKEKSAEVIFAELNSLIADQRREIAWLEAEIEKTKEDLALPAEERTATAADLNELENSLANATRNLRELENSRGSGEAALVDTLSTSSFESPLIATCKTILADPNSVKELVSLGSDLRLERMSVEKDLVAQQAAKRGMDVKIKALELCAGYSADKDNAKLPDSLKAMCDAQFEALAAN